MTFNIDKKDKKARACTITTKHSIIKTPVFMPVGTVGAIKSLDAFDMMNILDAKIILGNTYHLYLRPGCDVIDKFGGLHNFTKFNRSFLTDSGGFQAFSLSSNTKFSDDGIVFKSHIDGSMHKFTPKSVIEYEYKFNSDIMMILDDLIALPAPIERVKKSVERTIKWAKEAVNFHNSNKKNGLHTDNNIFGIIQGGVDYELRRKCALELCQMEFDGLAIGGLSVGEENSLMYDTIEGVMPFIDENRPRYLMGVGTPADIIEGVWRGVDMFDCVMPTRNARNGTLFTSFGKINIKSAKFIRSDDKVDDKCDCYTCRNFSAGYLNHLYRAKELTFFRLATLHNLHYYLNLMRDIRDAILEERFDKFRDNFYKEQAIK